MSDQGVKDNVVIPGPETVVDNTPAPEISLRDEIKTRIEAVKTAPEGETLEQRDARVRDEQGRFAEKPKDTKPARQVLTVAKPAIAQAPTDVTKAETAIPPISHIAPVSWTLPMKEEFSKLPANVQEYISAQEANARKALVAQDEDRSLGKGIREVAAPYLATIRAEGGDEKKAFAQFLNYAHIMRAGTPQQKLTALHQVAQAYSVNLGTPTEQGSRNPEFESLQQRLDQIERDRQQEIQQRQIQEQSALTSEIDAFKAAPGHEHYEQVKVLMGNLLLSEQAKDLQEAYDQAIWANPEIRSTLTAAQSQAAEQKRLSEANARTGAAKWAAGSITGGPGGVKPNGAVADRSLGEEIRANMQAATGRV